MILVYGCVKGTIQGRNGVLEQVQWREGGAQGMPSFLHISWIKADGLELKLICESIDGIPKPTPDALPAFPYFIWRSPESCYAITDTIRALFPPPPEPDEEPVVQDAEAGGDFEDDDDRDETDDAISEDLQRLFGVAKKDGLP